ncbi:MAG: hypothetical protein KKA79_07960 [Nanoarchaeota archaeon]|nr:hypothetical protein [Nanoarchaeota archaeon]MCG2717536.1 hypothetical protein [Nanoarchaeota archaeon]
MIGKEYFKNKNYIPETILKTYISCFKDCMLVLDAGCENNLLKKILPNVIDIDFSPHSKADPFGDLRYLPFKSETFDGWYGAGLPGFTKLGLKDLEYRVNAALSKAKLRRTNLRAIAVKGEKI